MMNNVISNYFNLAHIRDLVTGALKITPLCIAVLPWGLLAGSMAIQAGLSPAQAIGMSAFVFAGAAQLGASFYINAIPKTKDPKASLASVFGVIRNVSVPYGLNTEEEPNISSTRWRTVVDHKHKMYFFESALSPNIFWIDLKKINFKDGITKKLDLGKNQKNVYAGDATSQFKASTPFHFLGKDD